MLNKYLISTGLIILIVIMHTYYRDSPAEKVIEKISEEIIEQEIGIAIDLK